MRLLLAVLFALAGRDPLTVLGVLGPYALEALPILAGLLLTAVGWPFSPARAASTMAEHPAMAWLAWPAAEDFKAAVRRLVSDPGPSAEEVEAARAGIAALAAAPTYCPCGHALDSDLRCLNGRIYGPCDSRHCDGPCMDTYGTCDADICLCEEDE